MEIVSSAGICIVAAVICKVFDRFGREYSAMLSIAVSAAIMGLVLLNISPAADAAASLLEKAGVDSIYCDILFRSIGICYITHLACGVCRDCGEGSLAVQAELAGRAALILNALPLFTEVIKIADRLLSV